MAIIINFMHVHTGADDSSFVNAAAGRGNYPNTIVRTV